MDKIRACIPLPFSISNRNLLEETKAISIPEKNAEKIIDISSFIISPIYKLVHLFLVLGRIGRCCIFYCKNSCIIEYLIFCHLLVGFESISCQNLVRLFDTYELVGIYSFLPLIPIHQLGIKFITALTADVYIAAKFP